MTCIGGLLDKMTGSVILTAKEVKEVEDHIDQLTAENAKLREFASEAFSMAFNFYHGAGTAEDLRELTVEYREMGIEVGV